jgi:hypothetical protein
MADTKMADGRQREGNRAKSARHREKLKEQGLRPVQISVPDTRSPTFADEARRQSTLVGDSTDTAITLKFIRTIAAWR